MKKLLVLVLVLAIASSASALSAWFEVTGASAGPIGTYEGHDSYAPSTILTIILKADFAVGSINLGIGATAGTAEAIPTLNTYFNFLVTPGNLVNNGGTLISGVGGTNMTYFSTQTTATALQAGETILTWQFHVPDVPDSTLITIDNGINYVALQEGANLVSSIDPFIIHVAPEPMTIVLLGLGGLFLRRRK